MPDKNIKEFKSEKKEAEHQLHGLKLSIKAFDRIEKNAINTIKRNRVKTRIAELESKVIELNNKIEYHENYQEDIIENSDDKTTKFKKEIKNTPALERKIHTHITNDESEKITVINIDEIHDDLMKLSNIHGVHLDFIRKIQALIDFYKNNIDGNDTSKIIKKTGFHQFIEILKLYSQNIKIGPYHLENMIGSGGESRVYLAHDELRKYAIKIFDGDYNQLKKSENIKNEAKIISKINSKHVVFCYGFDTTSIDFQHTIYDGISYMAMEFMSNGSYLDIEKNNIQIDIVTVMRDILHGVSDIHNCGVIHNDLKPQNFLFNEQLKVKISDFGISKNNNEKRDIGGSFHYMAPEIMALWSNKKVDHIPYSELSDIYSIGCSFYRMVSGKTPMSHALQKEKSNGTTRINMNEIIGKYDIPKISSERHAISNKIQDIIMSCLSFNPQDRPRKIKDIINEFI